jgi:hypothetical protein
VFHDQSNAVLAVAQWGEEIGVTYLFDGAFGQMALSSKFPQS